MANSTILRHFKKEIVLSNNNLGGDEVDHGGCECLFSTCYFISGLQQSPCGKYLFWCLFFLLFCLFVLMNTNTRAELGLVWLWKEKKQKELDAEKRSSSNPQNLNHLAISQTRPKPKSTCKILFLTSHFFQSPQFSGAEV